MKNGKERIMEKLQFDSGIREYRMNGGGVLRFNPADPNLYVRFLELEDKLHQLESDLQGQVQQMQEQEGGMLRLLQEADRQMKTLLSWVFGQENDFHKLLEGVNLLAVGRNGQRVVTNLLQALQPVLVSGAESCAREKTQAAVAKAKARRAAQ